VVEDDILLLAALHEYKRGEDSGSGAVMTDAVQGHGWQIAAPFASFGAEPLRVGMQQNRVRRALTDYSAGVLSRKLRAEFAHTSPRASPKTKTGSIKLAKKGNR
jgi:hypothetical protein